MLTLQDIQNNLAFLNRVDLKGNESMAHAELVIKLQEWHVQLAQAAPPKDPPMEEPVDGKSQKSRGKAA